MMLQKAWAIGLCLMWAAGGISASQGTNTANALEKLRRAHSEPVLSGSLAQTFEQFQQRTGVPVRVDWEALHTTGVKRSDMLTVRAPKATGEQMLEMLLIRAARPGKPLAWSLHNRTVQITTQMRLLHPGPLLGAVRAPSPATVSAKAAGTTTPAFEPPPLPELFFDETPLVEAIDVIRQASGLNLHVHWRSLELLGITRNTPVTLQASHITVRRTLSLLTDTLSVNPNKLDRIYWVLDEGVVTIASGAALDTKMRTCIYDVSDLLVVVPNFPGRDLSVEAQSASANDRSSRGSLFDDSEDRDDPDDEDRGTVRRRNRENLIEIIKNSIGQEMWQPFGKGSIQLHGNKLIDSQTLLGFALLSETAQSR